MVYGYIRVSTDRQTVENQRFEIIRFCKTEKIKIEKWIEEKISGTKSPDKRQLGVLLREVKEGGCNYLLGTFTAWAFIFYDHVDSFGVYGTGSENLDSKRQLSFRR